MMIFFYFKLLFFRGYLLYLSNKVLTFMINKYPVSVVSIIRLYPFLKKGLVFNILLEKFVLYFKFFIYDFNKSENKLFKEKLDFALNQLILNIFYDIKNINPFIFFIPAYGIFVFLGNKDIIFIYLSYFLFSISFFIKLVLILKKLEDNKLELSSHPIIYNLIKYTLFGLLFINILVIVQLSEKLWILMITYVKNFILKIKIIDKLNNIKISLDYERLKNSKNPKNPKNSSLFSFFKQKKKKKEDIKEALRLKEKLLNLQKQKGEEILMKKIEEIPSISTYPKMTIEIPEKPSLRVSDQLERVSDIFTKYDDQSKKFKKIVINVAKNKENFYPDESTSLFKDYINVLKELKGNLRLMDKNLRKLKK